jgi:hypothetical protein
VVGLFRKNDAVQHLTTKHRKGKYIEIYSYRFVNQIPLREQEPSLFMNWCELTVRASADNGHGQKHLSSTLLSLNLLAFLFHTVLHLIDSSYQEIHRKRGTRRGFFQDILSLTKYFLFDSWQHLIEFMLGDTPVAPDSC